MPSPRHNLTAERLRQVLSYDPLTGVFRWRERTSNRVQTGDVAGTVGSYGYVQISVDGVIYRANRLAWLYQTGCWPKHQVDHENGVRADNRFDNLRDFTPVLNGQNRRTASRGSRSGLLGAAWLDARQCWQAKIRVDRKQRHIGNFKTEQEAHDAYMEAKRRLHPGAVT